MTSTRISRISSLVLVVFSLGLFAPTMADAKPPKAPKSRKAIVRAETVRLRTAPGRKAKMAGLLDGGRVARVLEKRDGWAKLKLESGTTGWVRADLLAINKKKTKDTGAFAKQHPLVAKSAPRRARRAKRDEPVVVKHTSAKRTKTVAAKKPAMKPMVRNKFAPTMVVKAKPRPVIRPRAISVAPVQIARVTPRPVPAPRPAVLRPNPAQDAQTETEPTPTYETASLREGVGSQMLATIPARAPETALPLPGDAVPAETTPTNDAPDETIAVSAPLPQSKPIKGKVAPAVNVPIERATKRGDRIVNRALSYRGTPYRMGATGRGAFDCSSFTRYILQQSGENLPRTAAEQYRKGTPVNKSEMRAGDLVFFKNTYKRGVSHVGIYMGDGKFVHASSHGGVKTSNLGDSYYVNHWAGARRPDITQEFK